MSKRRIFRVAVGLFFGSMMTVCFLPSAPAKDTVKLAYVEWSSSIASTNLVQAVLQEKMGYNCEIRPMNADEMWQAVADGEVDAMLSAWLPVSQSHFYEEYQNRVVNLGPNLKGARIGLVVPDVVISRQIAATGVPNKPYVTVDSIPELKDYAKKFNHKIIGIDPEAGIMRKTREAIQVYGLHNLRLVSGSEVSMLAEFSHAVRKHRWIVVTGWVPHWKFTRWPLKFLEDPKNIYGGEQHISTIARKGLQQDMPEVYQFLDVFKWSPEEMSQLLIWIHADQDMYPYENALRFIRQNKSLIESWLP
ncbi:MAG: glycine betaine ABC transporter substrate-binding protein [Desulfobacterales bacterium]|jgi:glycine betaine/proline transport system substrate-binding protein